MKTPDSNTPSRPFTVVDLNFISLYLLEYEQAIDFYTRVFGQAQDFQTPDDHHGWHMGQTWLTLFPARGGLEKDRNPCNTEFAVQVSTVTEVDILYDLLIREGAKSCMPPQDTEMYDHMRFCCVDDPFGVRIDVYCPLEAAV